MRKMPEHVRVHGLSALSSIAVGTVIVVASGPTALLISSLVGLLLVVALVVGLIRWYDDEAARNQVMWWTIVAFGTHLLFGLAVLTFTGGLRNLIAAPDAITYHREAVRLLHHWTEGFPAPTIPAGKEGYYVLVAWLYRVFGVHPSAAVAVNAALGAALVPVLTDTTTRLFGRSAARYTPPIIVLLPGVFLFTSQPIKEAPILFLVAVAGNAALRLSKRVSPSALLCMTLSVALLFTFRAWVALVMVAGLLIGIAVAKRELLSGVGIGLGTLALIAVLVVSLGLGYSGYQTAVQTDLKQASVVRQDLAANAGTGYDEEADISTPMRAVSYLPKGLVQFAFGPFPWQIRGVRQLALVPDMLAMWALWPSLWRGLRRPRGVIRRQGFVLIFPAITTGILLALSVGNYGTQLRERMQVIVLLVPFMAYGLLLRRGAKTEDPDLPESVRPPTGGHLVGA